MGETPETVRPMEGHGAYNRSSRVQAERARNSPRRFLALENLEPLERETGEASVVGDRIWEDYERTGDAKMFGAQWARFSRASVFLSLATGLHPGGARRTEEFFDRLEAGMAARLAAAPARTTIPLAGMALLKADATPHR